MKRLPITLSILSGAVLACLFLIPGASSAQAEPPHKDSPDLSHPHWVRLPDANDVNKFYPAEGIRHGYGGKAIIRCTPDQADILQDCDLLYVDPPELGFGEAALKVSAVFRIAPGAKAGERVTIPIIFSSYDTKTIFPGDGIADMKAVAAAVDPSTGLPIRAPLFDSASEPRSFVPYEAEKHRVSGVAVLRCLATPEGKISDCSLLFEAPNKWDFGYAGLALAKSGDLKVDASEGARDDQLVRVIIRFPKVIRQLPGRCCNADGSLYHGP